MDVKLISKTQAASGFFGKETLSPEEMIVAVARVSSGKPPEERTENAERLLKYCIKHGHWSIFETVSFTLYFKVPLFVATQILRHRSFTFQQFSQRYQTAEDMCPDAIELRRAGGSNRQGSGELIKDPAIINHNNYFIAAAFQHYHLLLEQGVSAETARQVLPQCTYTEIFMTGSARSWIHYFQTRLEEHTQKEHRQAAALAFEILKKEMPVIFGLIFG